MYVGRRLLRAAGKQEFFRLAEDRGVYMGDWLSGINMHDNVQ